jgi:hypothetical protein
MSKSKTKLMAAALSAILLGGSAASAAGLTTTLPATAARSATLYKDPVPGVVRQRDVGIDAAYLAQTIAPLGVDDVAGRAKMAPARPALVEIELFPGTKATLVRNRIQEATGGGFVWAGQEASGQAAGGDLVVRNGKITGVVTLGGRTYRIDPVPGSVAHRVREIDPSAYPEDIHKHITLPSPKSSTPMMTRATTTPTIINVLIGYTPKAKAAVTDITATMNLAVSMANSAFTRSKVPLQFKLVGTRYLSTFDETKVASYDQVLTDLTNNTTPFNALHSARNTLKADLVSVFINRKEYCGIAWGLYNPTTAYAKYGMSVVTVGCVSGQTFAHETGHNMGLRHDRYVEPAAPATAYNYGYVDTVGKFRDIMSYANKCTAAGITCTRIPYFSNPTVTYNGRPTGIAVGTTGAAYGARKLSETRTVISAFR